MSGQSAAMNEYGWTLECGFEHLGSPVSSWVHGDTGLRLMIAEAEGPVVEVFVPLATATEGRDDGCPHTLEHLVFLGSEEYPYKGVLDKVANRNLANGTNAWTAVDHTCYTLKTAGSEGALAMLPVYLEHLLFPTLTDSGFLTEIHHINKEGQSAGVVYCEMQGRENTMVSLMSGEMKSTLWEGTDIAYNSGGLMKDIRNLTNETIKKYHRTFYRPENMGIVIVGKVMPVDVAKATAGFVAKAQKREFAKGLPRPWQAPLPAFQSTVRRTVQVPAESEEDGWKLYLGWRGPLFADKQQVLMLEILIKYLSSTATSPLRAKITDCEDAVAGTASGYLSTRQVGELLLCFGDIRAEKIGEVEPRVLQTLKEAAEGLDVGRLRDLTRRAHLRYLRGFEDDPGTSFSDPLIDEFLYGDRSGNREATVRQTVDDIPTYEALLALEVGPWRDAFRRWILDAPYCSVTGQPSKARAESMKQEESTRDEQTRKARGEAGLEKLGKDLDAAQVLNDKDIPEEIERSFAPPSADSISLFSCKTFRTDKPEEGDAELRARLDGAPLGTTVHFTNVPTRFVSLTAFMDSTGAPAELWPYIELYLDLFFERPVVKGGKRMEFQETVAELERQTIGMAASQGGAGRQGRFTAGPWPEYTKVTLVFPSSGYEDAVEWLKTLLHNAEFPPDRVKISAQKLLDSITGQLREGSKVCTLLSRRQRLRTPHVEHSLSPLQQREILQAVLANPDRAVEKLKALNACLTSPASMRVHCVTDILSYPSNLVLRAPWSAHFGAPPAEGFTPPPFPRASAWSEKSASLVVGLETTDSCFLRRNIPLTVKWTDPDAAALMVATQLYTALEGPFWREIRGAGLSYSYSIRQRWSDASHDFVLFKSGQGRAAFERAAAIIREGSSRFTENDFVGARAVCIFDTIETISSVHDAARQVFFGLIRDQPPGWTRELISRFSKVTPEDVTRVSEQCILPLFDPKVPGGLVVVCNAKKASEVQEAFSDFGAKEEKLHDALRPLDATPKM
eukprot:Hpha_TRINITY_DN25839_c0_g1::TRINITY_DN25839_c0_g1_i1::g.19974::m.19974